MLNRFCKILFAKTIILILALFQSISIFAQHYSGRHVDEYDGGGSGGFLIIAIACLVIGAVIYFSILISNSITRTKTDTNPKKNLSIQERGRIEIERLNNKIQQAKKDSEEVPWTIIGLILSFGFFFLVGIFRSCS